MEQKKILWVFSILIAFLLIVFAVAWFFYSPQRSNNNTTVTNLEEKNTNEPALAKIDADSWAKNTDSIPKPSEEAPTTVKIDNNVTLVSGSDSNIDVKSLLDNEKKVEGTLPASISNTIIATLDEKEGLSDNKTSEQETNLGESDEKKRVKDNTTSNMKVTRPKNTSVAKRNPNKLASISKSTKSGKKREIQSTGKKVEAPKPSKLFWVQTASLTSRLYAEEARKRLQDKNLNAEIFTKETIQGLTHRVRVGPFANKTEATYWLASIKKIDGFESSFISEERFN